MYYSAFEKKEVSKVAEEFLISLPTAKKYIQMSKEEIQLLDNPQSRKKRKTVMDDYINIIYKMLYDGIRPEIIFSYIVYKGYDSSWDSLEICVRLLAQNNFGIKLRQGWYYEYQYPIEVEIIKRNELLIYITSKKSLDNKYPVIVKYMDIVKQKYPIVKEVEELYKDFHEIIMGDNCDKLDKYIEINKDSIIKSFINGLKKDITPVKNAISFEESSGFVEGNNNKFKLIKRILYGRTNLVNLYKKCYFAFKINDVNFDIKKLIKVAFN